MKYIKGINEDGKIEYVKESQVLSVLPRKNGYTKFLLGACLSWELKTETIELVTLEKMLQELKGGL